MKNISNSILEEFVVRNLVRLRTERPAAIYLEIGCGDLRYRKYLDENSWSCIFTDVEVRGEGVSLLADAQNLPFPDCAFDVVLMTEVLEHIPDVDKALSEISRILKPGGVLIVTFPFIYGLHELPRDFRRWTEFNATYQFDKVGLKTRLFQRRGDGIAVMITLYSQLAIGLAARFKRQWFLWPIFAIVNPIVWASIALAVGSYCYLWSKVAEVRVHQNAGDGLKGFKGHLRLWHLGYQFICEKT